MLYAFCIADLPFGGCLRGFGGRKRRYRPSHASCVRTSTNLIIGCPVLQSPVRAARRRGSIRWSVDLDLPVQRVGERRVLSTHRCDDDESVSVFR